MRPRDLFQVDVELEQAFEEARRRARRVPTGRIFLEIHRLGDTTVEYRIHEDRSTERDIERVMQEPPQARAAAATGARARRAG